MIITKVKNLTTGTIPELLFVNAGGLETNQCFYTYQFWKNTRKIEEHLQLGHISFIDDAGNNLVYLNPAYDSVNNPDVVRILGFTYIQGLLYKFSKDVWDTSIENQTANEIEAGRLIFASIVSAQKGVNGYTRAMLKSSLGLAKDALFEGDCSGAATIINNITPDAFWTAGNGGTILKYKRICNAVNLS